MAVQGADASAGGRRRGVRRSRLAPETRRAQLIDTATSLLAERGLGAFNVDDVADAAGVSRSLVYAYFGDRDGLAAEVYLRTLDRLDRDVGLRLASDEAALQEIVGACMAFAQENHAAWQLLVVDPSRQHPLVQAARAERAARLSRDWDGGAAGAGGRGETGAAQLAAEAALGMLESGVLHWLEHPDVPADEATSLLATILGSGLASRRLGSAG